MKYDLQSGIHLEELSAALHDLLFLPVRKEHSASVALRDEPVPALASAFLLLHPVRRYYLSVRVNPFRAS